MKRFFLLIVLIAVFFIMPNSVNAQGRFIWINSTETTTYSLDTQSIISQGSIIDCWIKSDYTQEGIDSNVNYWKKRGQNEFAEKTAQCTYELTHWQYNTNKPYKLRVVGSVMYDKKGNVLYNDQTPSDWDAIVPDTIGESNFNKIYSYVLVNNIK